MIRTPLRPLARILSARQAGQDPDEIEAGPCHDDPCQLECVTTGVHRRAANPDVHPPAQ